MSTEATSPKKAKHRQAAEALNAISALVRGPRGAKKAAKQEAKLQRKDSHKAKLLAMLTTEPLKLRTALIKAAVAVKNGANAEELQACTALQAVTDWSKLAEPIGQFALAKGVDLAPLLAGLGCTAPTPTQEAAKAPAPSIEAAPATDPPKGPPQPEPKPKPLQGRHTKGRA